MSEQSEDIATRFKVGFFAVLGLILVGVLTVFVNDKPFWWRTCQLVHINIEDATGLKTKSPVRSLGLQIGYLKTINLSETHVRLGICITAPVEVLPQTRAYIRGEGFLGDKFVELKPVKYLGGEKTVLQGSVRSISLALLSFMGGTEAHAAENARAAETAGAASQVRAATRVRAEEIRRPDIPVGGDSRDVQEMIKQVDRLMEETTNLMKNLKTALPPEELQESIKSLNSALKNAAATLSPRGSLNTTAQRTLEKLEEAISQLQDQMEKINRGEGSLGRILNDPVYADELEKALKKLNKLLGRADDFRFVVDIGASTISGYDSSRAWIRLGIWPSKTRYYLLGFSTDPRGDLTITTTTTEVAGVQTVTKTTHVEENGFVLTGMIGKVFFERLDLSIGVLHGDGAFSAKILLGPYEDMNMIRIQNDLYARRISSTDTKIDARTTIRVNPWSALYIKGGLESYRKVNDRVAYLVGAGIKFDDEDIKFLASLLF